MDKHDVSQQIDKALARMRTLRDDLRVRIHLGGMDLKDALRDLEARLDDAERAAKNASDALLQKLGELDGKFMLLSEKLASAQQLDGKKGERAS